TNGGTSFTATTNATGNYTITATSASYPANFNMTATAPGFITSAANFVRLRNTNSTETIDIELDPKTKGVIISGTVRISGTNTGIAGAKVLIRTGNFNPVTIDSAVTAANGTYSIDSVQAGTINMVASATGYTPVTVNNITVGNNDITRSFNLTALGAGVVMSGTVRNANNNNPIAGAKVILRTGGVGGTAIDSAISTATGTYTIDSIQPGTYTTFTSATGFISRTSNSIPVANTAVTNNVQLTPAPAPTTILGVVADATTATGIVGAKIILRSGNTKVDSVLSGANGLYSFANVAAGTYTTITTFTGYLAATSNAITVASTPVTNNIQLTAIGAGVVVSGTVTNSTTAAAVSGAKVVLIDNTNARVDSAVTSANGTYSIDSVSAGTYSIRVTATGYTAFASNTFTVVAAAVTRNAQIIPLPPATTILGVVTNATTSAALVGAKVVLVNNAGASVDSAVTVAGGVYSLSNVEAGTYSTVTSLANYVTRTTRNITVSGSPVTSNVALTPITYVAVSGTVTIAGSATAIAGAQVILVDNATGLAYDTVTSAANGTYTVSNVATGTYVTVASANGYVTSTSATFTVAATAVTRNIQLSAKAAGSMVIGIVTDQSNNDPMTGVKILLQQQITLPPTRRSLSQPTAPL
ncbi:MAG: carboxypeptidase-like regulatory domain-containing protein, partial [Chitinispirillaceae bacterium]|nr:carboxypeptidase-like regulatory domain-containing protein [Chitinispirillaceae bacterium]